MLRLRQRGNPFLERSANLPRPPGSGENLGERAMSFRRVPGSLLLLVGSLLACQGATEGDDDATEMDDDGTLPPDDG